MSKLIALDDNGKIVHWNQAAQRILGLAESQVVGRVLHECDIAWGFPFPLEKFAPTLTKTSSVVLRDVPLHHGDGQEAILGFSCTDNLSWKDACGATNKMFVVPRLPRRSANILFAPPT
ncbi:MAG: PAS domain-containing protein [Blastocatellia bacterium]